MMPLEETKHGWTTAIWAPFVTCESENGCIVLPLAFKPNNRGAAFIVSTN
jgi:hypothetical protein